MNINKPHNISNGPIQNKAEVTSDDNNTYPNTSATDAIGDVNRQIIIDNISSKIAFHTPGTKEKLANYDTETLKNLYNSLEMYYHDVAKMTSEKELDPQFERIGESLARNFSAKLVEGNFLRELSKYSVESVSDSRRRRGLVHGIKAFIEGTTRNENNGELFGEYMDYYKELLSDAIESRTNSKLNIFRSYVLLHGVNTGTIDGFRNIVFPLIENGDPETKPIMTNMNAFGIGPGTYGIADYTEECLLASYTPKEINKLIRLFHEIPTSEYKKFEQNRKDAARLEGGKRDGIRIISSRDFIHDQRLGVHEVLLAMRNYYDSNGSQECLDKLKQLEDEYGFGILPYATNLEAYKMRVPYMSEENFADKGSPDETALDLLNRLIENTQPSLLKPPETKDEELNRLIRRISPEMNERTGELFVDFRTTGIAVTRMNELLLANWGRQGILPSMVAAMVYLDKMSTHALRGLGEKEIEELPFDPGFKEMVRFSCLTSSIKYDDGDFELKYQRILDIFSKAYSGAGIDHSRVFEGYQLLTHQILDNIQGLVKHYAQKTTTRRFCKAVWSGDLSDELTSLITRVRIHE